MQEKLDRLAEICAEIADIDHSIDLLGWDQQVFMPPGGSEERGHMMATLGKLSHEKFTSPEMGQLIDALEKYLPNLDPDSDEYRTISVTAHDFHKISRVPASFVIDKARVLAAAQAAWLTAREQSNYAHFAPHLSKVIDLARQYASFFPGVEHPYDALLDEFEPGMKTADIKSIFAELRSGQVPLIQRISECPQPEDSFMYLDYDEAKMWQFSVQVATAFGYDWSRGRQDPTAHPFCQSIGPDDVRITSRWNPAQPFALLFGTMHETGHALYEQGVGRTYDRTQLEGGTSLGIHESQSRMWENLVGRSLPFWEYFYPRLQATFPTQLGAVPLEHFYRAINRVKPSLIRIEADEATYNLHIMLRFELETGILDGTYQVHELPALWNARMQEYLGIVPPNDAKGILQDIHWSGGLVGYFPTYTLGNLISAQLMERFRKINPNLDDEFRSGDFSSLLSWNRLKIHQFGRKYEPQELIERVTRRKIDPQPYLNYLTTKYQAIYGLK